MIHSSRLVLTVKHSATILLALVYCLQPIFPWIQNYTHITHPFINLAGLLLFLILVLACLYRFSLQHLQSTLKFPDAVMGIFVAYVVISLMRDPAYLPGNVHIILAGGIIYALARVIGLLHPSLFCHAFITIAMVICLISVLDIIHMEIYLHPKIEERLYIFTDITAPQWPCLMLGAAILMLWSRALQATSPFAFFACVIVASLLYSFIIYAGARGLIIAIILATFMILALYKRHWRKRLFLLMITLMLPLASLHVLPEKRSSFIKNLAVTATVEEQAKIAPIEKIESGECVILGDSLLMRKIFYKNAWLAFTDHPWFGVGAGEFGNYSCITGFGKRRGEPHSTILHVASELGIAGLILFLSLLGWIGWQSVHTLLTRTPPWYSYALFGAWFYQLINDQFSASYLATIPFYILSGVLVSIMPFLKKSH